MEVGGTSLPSNYISILQLKARWLQQQHQEPAKSQSHDDKAKYQPNGEVALRRVPRQRPGRPGVTSQIIPVVAIDDSATQTQVDAADNHPKGAKEEHKADHSNSKLSKKKRSSRALKPRSVTNQNRNGGGSLLLVPEAVKEKKQTRHVGGHRNRHQNVVREPIDRMTTFAQNVDRLSQNDSLDHGVVEAVAATVDVHIVSRGANRRYQGKPKSKPSSDQNVICEAIDKMTQFARNVDELSHNNARGNGVVKAVSAAAVSVPIVNQEANRRGGAGRFQGKPKPKPSSRPCESSFWVKKGQTSLVWVKKAEPSAN